MQVETTLGSRIRAFLREGKTIAFIMKETGCSRSGVRYYIERREPRLAETTRQGMKIRELLRQNVPYSAITRETGCAGSTISYHAKRIGKNRVQKWTDWESVQQFYNDGHTAVECIKHFGINQSTWSRAISSGHIKIANIQLSGLDKETNPLDQYLNHNGRISGSRFKKLLIESGKIRYECSWCYIQSWRGEKLNLHLDHIDGNNGNNRLDNLRFLCPNCHSQTETYCGRSNRGKHYVNIV